MSIQTYLSKKVSIAIFIALNISIAILASSLVISVKAIPLTITVSPTNGPVGTLTTVTGTNATPFGEIRIYLSMLVLGFFAATTTANSTGGFSASFSIPTLPAGDYFVMALDVTTGDTGLASFIVEPQITLIMIEGSSGEKIDIEGHGFDSSTSLKLAFDGDDVTPTPQPFTGNLGSFKTNFVVPDKPRGTYLVEVNDGSNTVSARFEVIPKITLNPTSGSTATIVMVTGTGFAPSVSMSIEINAINVTMYPSFPTTPDGSFTQFFLVPEIPDGTHVVTATDEIGNSALAPFALPSPSMSLTPNVTSGPCMVTANGVGFPPSTPIALYIEGNSAIDFIDLMTDSQEIYTDEFGSYEFSFIAPLAKPGLYHVIAHSITGGPGFIGEQIASAWLEITEDALLIEINNMIATILIPDLGSIKTDLSGLDAKLIEIEGNIATMNSTIGLIQADLTDLNLNVTSINGNLVTIQTVMGTIEGEIASIEGDTVTIMTDIGAIETDISRLQDGQAGFTIPLYGTLILGAISAIAAVVLLAMHIQVMRKTKKA
ncbi:MAG: hypothetical protein JSV05_04535 [Candidatus Bathyarchaeota archaeon]|nr:MAG: hypothetical protein JSV05_04535 [Candidatus Bathyarchaeota archaeon]